MRIVQHRLAVLGLGTLGVLLLAAAAALGLSKGVRRPARFDGPPTPIAALEMGHPDQSSMRPLTGPSNNSPVLNVEARGTEFEVPPLSPLATGPFVNFESPQVKPLALSSDGTTLFAANTPNNRLVILNTVGGLSFAHEIPVGLDPVTVAVQPGSNDQLVWVANFVSDNVSVVDVVAGKVVSVIEVGDEPVNILFDPTGNVAFVVIQGIQYGTSDFSDPVNPQRGHVVVIDTAARKTVSTTYLDCNTPRAAVYDPVHQHLVVAALFSGNNTTLVGTPIDLQTNLPPPKKLPSPCEIACNCACLRTTILEVLRDFPPTASLFASTTGLGVWPDQHVDPEFPASPNVHRIVKDLGTPGGWQDIVATLADGQGAPDAAIVDQMNLFFDIQNADEIIQVILDEAGDTMDTDLVVLDASSPSDADGLPIVSRLGNVGTTLTGMGRDPVSGTLFVANMEAQNTTRLVQSLRGRVVDHQIVMLDDPVNPTNVIPVDLHFSVSAFNDVSGPNPTAQAASLANPLDIAFDEDGGTAFVVALGPGRVGALNAMNGRVVGRVDVGRGPRGLALDSAADRLYVLNRTDMTISVVDVSDPTQMTAEPAFALYNPEPAEIREGRDFLFSTRFSNNYASSCAVCHIDGHLDHLAWDLGNPQGDLQPGPPNLGTANHPIKGPMVTLSLRGLRGHNFLHWRSDKPTFQDFNEAFVNLLGAEQELSSEEMDAYTAFVETMVYPPSPFYKRNNAFKDDRAFDGGVRYLTHCDICHQVTHDGSLRGDSLLPPVTGDGGVNLSDGGLFAQLQEVTQMRGIVEKFQSDRLNGFGLLHDGRFDRQSNDHPMQTFLQRLFSDLTADERLDIIAFLNAFQSNVMSVVGWQVLAVNLPGPVGPLGVPQSVISDVNQMVAQYSKSPSHCDVVAHGIVGAASRGYVLTSTDPEPMFTSDLTTTHALTDLLAALSPADRLTFSAVPPGSGRRMGIDQDLDCLGDGHDPFPQSNNAGDGTLDGQVNLQDFLQMVDCAALDGPLSPECTLYDMNCDSGIQVDDLNLLLTLYEDPMPDCTGNGTVDLIDIFNGSSIDADRNGVPDQCVSFVAEAAGARYLKLQVAGIEPVALRVTSPQYPCLDKYVDALGYLVDAPVIRDPAQWGTVFVGDSAIVPSSDYRVESEVDGVRSSPAQVLTRAWGEVTGLAPVDVDDVLCILDLFVGIFSQCSLHEGDMMDEVPNRGIDVDDILAVLEGFSGNLYPFPAPCD